MKTRVYVIAAVLIAFGIALQAAPRAMLGEGQPESWLETQAPNQVGEYVADKALEYRMDEYTYKELKPFGIVVRVFRSGSQGYDVAMIASNKKESFHDQRVCFSSQGWTLVGDHLAFADSKARGKVPVTVLELSSAGRGMRRAVLFYKGPGGFHSNPRALAWAMFKEQLWFWRKPNLDSVFYRIIPLQGGATEKELLTFTAELLDAANESSKGYF